MLYLDLEHCYLPTLYILPWILYSPSRCGPRISHSHLTPIHGSWCPNPTLHICPRIYSPMHMALESSHSPFLHMGPGNHTTLHIGPGISPFSLHMGSRNSQPHAPRYGLWKLFPPPPPTFGPLNLPKTAVCMDHGIFTYWYKEAL